MNKVFRLCDPVSDIDTYICKVTLVIKQANHGKNTVLLSALGVFNM